jgi:hypothetical protein
MLTNHLSDEVVTDIVADPAAMATTAIESAVVDLDGYDGVRFLVPITDVANTSVITATHQQGAASNLSDATTSEETATKTSGADDDLNGKLLILDVIKTGPDKRYARCRVTRATANAATGPIIAERYRARRVPVTQSADVTAIRKSVSPTAS